MTRIKLIKRMMFGRAGFVLLRQLALPQTEDLPPPFRRLDDVCAPGYRSRKRGQVVRTRTVIRQAHSFQWLGSFGNKGNGRILASRGKSG